MCHSRGWQPWRVLLAFVRPPYNSRPQSSIRQRSNAGILFEDFFAAAPRRRRINNGESARTHTHTRSTQKCCALSLSRALSTSSIVFVCAHQRRQLNVAVTSRRGRKRQQQQQQETTKDVHERVCTQTLHLSCFLQSAKSRMQRLVV